MAKQNSIRQGNIHDNILRSWKDTEEHLLKMILYKMVEIQLADNIFVVGTSDYHY